MLVTEAKGFVLSGPSAPLRELAIDFWNAREILVLLSRKEFFAKYRRASLGVLWAVAVPLLQAAVMAIVVGHFVRFRTGHNYPLYVFSGTLPWNFFSTAIVTGTTSIVDNSDMSSKIYFPRALFPLTIIGAGLYGFAVSLMILVGFTLVVGEAVALHMLYLIPATILVVMLSSALALALAGLDVYFRDLKYMVSAIAIPWFYLTPIFYPLNAVKRLRPLIEANPMTGVVEMFRAATTSADKGWEVSLLWTGGWIVVVLGVALWVHHRFDRVFSDLM